MYLILSPFSRHLNFSLKSAPSRIRTLDAANGEGKLYNNSVPHALTFLDDMVMLSVRRRPVGIWCLWSEDQKISAQLNGLRTPPPFSYTAPSSHPFSPFQLWILWSSLNQSQLAGCEWIQKLRVEKRSFDTRIQAHQLLQPYMRQTSALSVIEKISRFKYHIAILKTHFCVGMFIVWTVPLPAFPISNEEKEWNYKNFN